ncbi:fimbrial protein [Xanthomonas axonopodis]
MNKRCCRKASTSCLLLMAVACMSSSTAFADDKTPPTPVTVEGGTVHFTGALVNAACSLDIGSEDQAVGLGQVRADSLTQAGDTSAPVPFTIRLADCALASGSDTVAPYSKVKVTFIATPAGGNTNVIALGDGGGASTAKNVGVEILDAGKPVTIDGSQADVPHQLGDGSNTLNFSAAFVATKAGVTAGSADALASFKLSYE